MYTLYKFHFLNGISEINQLFDDILIIWPAPIFIEYAKLFTFYNSNIVKYYYDFLWDFYFNVF